MIEVTVFSIFETYPIEYKNAGWERNRYFSNGTFKIITIQKIIIDKYFKIKAKILLVVRMWPEISKTIESNWRFNVFKCWNSDSDWIN